MEKVKKVMIDPEICKGCELCISVCPKQVLEVAAWLNSKGFAPSTAAHLEECIRCGFCASICPDMAIRITEETK